MGSMLNKTCSLSNCSLKHYAKGYCRNHYRTIYNMEGKKYFQKIKSDPERYARLKASTQKYYLEKQKGTEAYRAKQRARQRKYYHDESKGRKEYLRNWKKSLPKDKKREYYKKDNATRQFGQYRIVEEILLNYGNACYLCHMPNDKHLSEFGSRLSLHHKDGKGRNVPRHLKNNTVDNLIPLCKRCHQKAHKGTILV